jgi:Flp pilus assembly protein TadG
VKISLLDPGASASLPRPKRRGQAVAEVALLSVLLALLLAGAVDYGRAFYTSVVVTNMAGEGASYAAIYPDQDADALNNFCSIIRPVPSHKAIQERARRVAKDRGLIIERGDQNLAQITVTTEGYGTDCSHRCAGRTIVVRVTYTLDDLFLPGILGIHTIPITKSASQEIMTNPARNGSCSGPTDN